MATIFVSYRRSDAPAHAAWLYEGLAQRFGETNVFKDVDALEPGADFVEVIEDTLSRCDLLIAVIGRGWLEAQQGAERRLDNPEDWVRLEILTALKRNIRVIPVLVAGASMPRTADLPEELWPLARRHAHELVESAWKSTLIELLDLLENALTPRRPAYAPQSRQAAPLLDSDTQRRSSSQPATEPVTAGSDRRHPQPTPASRTGTATRSASEVHRVGPSNGFLRIRTGADGPAAKMGHNLILAVESWEATVDLGARPRISLSADPGSVRVLEGSGGAKPLSDKDKNDIRKSIVSKVLGSSQITFQSSSVERNGDQLLVKGDLSVAGKSSPVAISLSALGDKLSGSTDLSQRSFGIKPFSAMMGALKVPDTVEVLFEAGVPAG